MASVAIGQYRIGRQCEEGACTECGFPLDLGDVAFELTEAGDTVDGPLCGMTCAKGAKRAYLLAHDENGDPIEAAARCSETGHIRAAGAR